MKKTLLLVAALVGVVGAKAQTESWSVNNSDGTLKDVYVANPDNTQMSVVEFSSTNVKGTHVSGPVAGYVDGSITPLEKTYDNSWNDIKKQDLSADGSVAPFYYVQGKGNPVNIDKVTFEEIMTDGVGTGVYRAYWNDAYYSPDGTNGLPTNGTYVTLTPSVNGKIKVAVWVNKGNRDVYVAKASDAKALSYGSEATISGYVNGQKDESGNMLYMEEVKTKNQIIEENNANLGEGETPTEIQPSDYYTVWDGNQAAWIYITFNATAGETYYVLNKSTQIGFGGYEFTPETGAGINEIEVAADDPNAPVYNLAGQRVSKDTKGILIQNGKKFINR